MTKIRLEVGKTYKTRLGLRVTITGINPEHQIYRYHDERNRYYRSDGKIYHRSGTSASLVESV